MSCWKLIIMVKLFGVISVDLLSAVHQDQLGAGSTEPLVNQDQTDVASTESVNACLDDGKVCFPWQCQNCCNKETHWYSKSFSACGVEPCWEDGTRCAPHLSCHQCCSLTTGPWYSKGGFIACGLEPCWPAQHDCQPGLGNSCDRCCRSNTLVEFVDSLPMILQGVIKNATVMMNNIPAVEEMISNMPTAVPTIEEIIGNMRTPEEIMDQIPTVKKVLSMIKSMVPKCT